jgi:hypothetical protein
VFAAQCGPPPTSVLLRLHALIKQQPIASECGQLTTPCLTARSLSPAAHRARATHFAMELELHRHDLLHTTSAARGTLAVSVGPSSPCTRRDSAVARVKEERIISGFVSACDHAPQHPQRPGRQLAMPPSCGSGCSWHPLALAGTATGREEDPEGGGGRPDRRAAVHLRQEGRRLHGLQDAAQPGQGAPPDLVVRGTVGQRARQRAGQQAATFDDPCAPRLAPRRR